MEELQRKVKEVLDEAVSSQFVSGASVLVIKDGKELCYEQAGYRDLETKSPMDRDTICRLYSMTKPITAVAVMILMERGLIDLSDTVETYIDGFANLRTEEKGRIVTAKRSIMLRELLNMTSGCLYPGDQTTAECEAAKLFQTIDDRLYGDHPMTTMEIVNAIGKLPTGFQPGTHWRYGTSADVLGGIVEKVSGMRFGEFLQKEIFGPLGMKDTAFYVPREKRNRLAKAYEWVNGSLQEYRTNNLGIRYTQDVQPAFESGGAGLVSTLDDYAKFAQMLMNEGTYQGVTILKSATVSFMTQAKLLPWQQLDLDTSWENMTGYTYGNLMRIMNDPGLSFALGTEGEYGWDGWLGAYFCNSPKDNLTYLMFMQKRDAGTNQLTRKVKNVIFSHIKK